MTPNELVWPPTDSERRSMILLHRIVVYPRGSTVDQATGVTDTLAHILINGVYTTIKLIIPPNLIQDETRRARNLYFNRVPDPQICLYVDVYGNFFPTARYGETTGTTRNAGLILNVVGLNVRTDIPNEPHVPLNTPAERAITRVPFPARTRGRGRGLGRGGSTKTNIAGGSQPQRQPQLRPLSATAITSGQETTAVTKEQTDKNKRVTRSQKRKAEELEPESSTAAQKRKIRAKSSTAAQKVKVEEQPKAKPITAAQKRKAEEQSKAKSSTAAQKVKAEEQPEAEPSTSAQKVKVEEQPSTTAQKGKVEEQPSTAAQKGKQKEPDLQ